MGACFGGGSGVFKVPPPARPAPSLPEGSLPPFAFTLPPPRTGAAPPPPPACPPAMGGRRELCNISKHIVGWIDWNLALDMRGGPNFIKNFVDSPILVNAVEDEFYKQPMFYHLAHFSKFIPEGSVRVLLACNSLLGNCQLKTEGFLRPDGVAVVVVLNKCFRNVSFSISDDQLGYIEDVAPANSIQTYLWKTSGACLGGKGQGKCLLPTK